MGQPIEKGNIAASSSSHTLENGITSPPSSSSTSLMIIPQAPSFSVVESSNAEPIETDDDLEPDVTLVPQPATAAEERDVIVRHWDSSVKKNHRYYVISSQWFISQWSAYTGFDYTEPKRAAKQTSQQRPGAIDNSSILIPDRQWAELRPNLQHLDDYVIVNKHAWQLLLHWYGVVNQDKPSARHAQHTPSSAASQPTSPHHAPTTHHSTPHIIERTTYTLGTLFGEEHVMLYPVFLQLSFVDTTTGYIDTNRQRIIAPFPDSATLIDVLRRHAPSPTPPTLTKQQQLATGGKLLYGRVWIRSEALNVRNEMQIDELKRVYSVGEDATMEDASNDASSSLTSSAVTQPAPPLQIKSPALPSTSASPSPRHSASLSPQQHAAILDVAERDAAMAADEWVLLDVDKHFKRLDELEYESGMPLLIEYRNAEGWWSRSSVSLSTKLASSKLWRDFAVGDRIDALDREGKWYEAEIKNIDENKGLVVHFAGMYMPFASHRAAHITAHYTIGQPTHTPHIDASTRNTNATVNAPISNTNYYTSGWEERHNEAINPVTEEHRLAPVNTRTCGKYVRTEPVKAEGDGLPGGRASSRNNSFYSPTSVPTIGTIARRHSLSKPIQRGAVGLRNLGNTCFMNSVLQCMSNTTALTQFFFDGEYKDQLNRDNPLGWRGRIAEEYANLIQEMWSGKYSTVDPRPLKTVIGQFQPRFSGYAQHDSSELLSFLLDGLHEDLNRVKKKRFVEQVESNGRNDKDVAREAWQRHLIRNQSIIVDLFQGQLKSTIVCPECGRHSVTFDPMMFLSVPIPETQSKTQDVHFVPAMPLTNEDSTASPVLDENGNVNPLNPIKLTLKLSKYATIADVKQEVIKTLQEPRITSMDQLVVAEIYNRRVWELFDNNEADTGKWMPRDEYFVYELHPNAAVSLDLNNGEDWEMMNKAESSSSTAADTIQPLDADDKESDTIIDDHVLSVVPFSGGINDNSDDSNKEGLEYISVNFSRVQEVSYAQPGATHFPTWVTIPKKHLSHVPADALLRALQYSMLPVINPLKRDQWLNQAVTSFNELPFRVALTDRKSGTRFADLNSDEQTHTLKSDDNTSSIMVDPDSDGMQLGNDDEANRIAFDAMMHRNTNNTYANGIRHQPQHAASEPTYINFSQYGAKQRYSYMADKGFGIHIIFPQSFATDWLTSGTYGEHPSVAAVASDLENAANKQLTVNDCISAFVAEETLGVNDSWYCNKCKKHQQATKKFDLWRLPGILIIHLKRFSYNSLYRDKIDKFIDFPIHNLDLSEWLVNDDPYQKANAVYDLYAVSNHFGGLGGGHYTAFAENIIDHKWYRLDDTMVTPVADAADAKSSAAYVLFYKRKNIPNDYRKITRQELDDEHKENSG